MKYSGKRMTKQKITLKKTDRTGKVIREHQVSVYQECVDKLKLLSNNHKECVEDYNMAITKDEADVCKIAAKKAYDRLESYANSVIEITDEIEKKYDHKIN